MWIFILILLVVFIIVSLFCPSRKDSELAEQYIQDKEQRHREEMKSKSSAKPFSQAPSISDIRGRKLFELEHDERSGTLCMLAEKYQAESTNPKFHRTGQEKQLSSNFYLKYYDAINKYEDQIYNEGKPFDKSLGVLDCISACDKSLSAFNNLRLFCYQSEGGKIYFQDRWEYCHNSKVECFSFDEKLRERLEYLEKNKALLLDKECKLSTLSNDLLDYLKSHADVIQKNIYSDFNPLLKSEIQKNIREFEKDGTIRRTKCKGSYLIELL